MCIVLDRAVMNTSLHNVPFNTIQLPNGLVATCILTCDTVWLESSMRIRNASRLHFKKYDEF